MKVHISPATECQLKNRRYCGECAHAVRVFNGMYHYDCKANLCGVFALDECENFKAIPVEARSRSARSQIEYAKSDVGGMDDRTR